MSRTTYVKAINGALHAAMAADERVIVIGEDVAEGGPYTATAGLADEFGTARVLNTPISEAAIAGVVSVHGLAGHHVGGDDVGDPLDLGVGRARGELGEAVVLAHQDARQLPQRGKVD